MGRFKVAMMLIASALLGYGLVSASGIASATHEACPSSDRRVIVSPDTNGRGVRVGDGNPGMLVVNNTIPCARASSLSVVNSAETRAVEIGWYEETVNVTPCQQTSGPPRILVAKAFDGVFTCSDQAQITNTPRDDDFYVHDSNQDGQWRYFRNGTFLGFFGLGTFVTGNPRAQGERKNDHDTAFSNFNGLRRMGAGASWANWQGTVLLFDTDEDFRADIQTATRVNIVQQ